MSGYICSHILVCMHQDKILNVFSLLASLQPARKRGRPKETGHCLSNDSVLNDVEKRAPHSWRNSSVRHPIFKNGLVTGVENILSIFILFFTL